MNPKGYYTAVFSIILLALAASYILFPSYKEVSLMYFYDRRYEEAYDRFSNLYKEGDQSVSVAIPLVWLDLNFAQGDHASEVLEEYVKEHPYDVGAKEYFSQLLRDLSRPHRSLEMIRGIYGIKPLEEGRTYEEELYLHLGDFQGQRAILTEMVNDGAASQEQYVEYAYLLASEGKMDDAVKVLQKLVKDKPLDEIGQDTMVFIISVLMDFGDKHQAHTLAMDYIKHFTKFNTTLALIGLFDSHGDDQFVIQLIDHLPVTLQHHPVIVLNRAKQLMDLGRSDIAYHFLVKQFGNNPPKEVMKDFFLLALEQEKNEEKLLSYAQKIDFSNYDREDLYRLARRLVERDHQLVARELSDKIPQEFYEESPALGLAFELAEEPVCEVEEECEKQSLVKGDVDDGGMTFLDSMYNTRGYKKQAQDKLLDFFGLENIHGSEVHLLARMLIEKDHQDITRELTDKMPQEVFEEPPVLGLAFQIAEEPVCEVKEECEIQSLVKSDDADGGMTFLDSMYNTRGYKKRSQEYLVNLFGPENDHKDELHRLATILVEGDHQRVDLELSEKNPQDFYEETPVLVFDLADKPLCGVGEECDKQAVVKEDVSDEDKAFLAYIYKVKGYKKKAQKELSNLFSLENIPGDELFEVAKLYVDLDLSEKGLKLIEELREKKPSKESEVDEAWVILAADEGKVDEVTEFLDHEDSIDEIALEELFYLSVEKKYNKLAYKLGLELYDKEQTPERKEMLALGMILNDKIDEGMMFFHELKEDHDPVSDNYFYGLSIAAKKDPKYRETLKTLISEKINKGGLTEKEKRNYAFILLDSEFKEDAASLFYHLAENKPFGNDDVQSLLYTWGKNLSDQQMQWVMDRAKAAQGKEKGKWLEQLLYVGNPQSVANLTTLQELGVDEIADAYIAAGTTLNNRQMVTSAVTAIYPKEERLPRLRKLGELARGNELPDIARKIYLRILEQEPNDPKALEAMGGLYYNEGASRIAKYYFKKFLEVTEKDNYQVNHYLGEILWEEDKRQLAREFYDRALYLICTDDPKAPELKMEKPSKEDLEAYHDKLKEYRELEKAKKLAQAQMYHRLDKQYLAIGIYRHLMSEYPESPQLRIEFANLLMDLTKYRSASRLLCLPFYTDSSSTDHSLNIDYYLARARLLRESNYVHQSIKCLQSLYPHGVEDARVDSSLADSFFVSGHWHMSMHFINQAIDKKPLNEGYRKSRREIVWEHLPAFHCNYEYRKTGFDQIEHFFRYGAFTHLSPFIALEGKVDVDKIELGALTSVQTGLTAPFRGVRKKGELSVYSSNRCGDVRKGTLFYSEGIFGAGVELKKFFYNDILTFGVDWSRPDWETIQSTIERGTRDQVHTEWYHRLNRLCEFTIGLDGNRYNLWHFPGAAVTWELEGLLSFKLPQQPCLHRFLGEEATLAINYLLDKEQILRLRKKIGVDGEIFTPLPLLNREVHTFFVFLSKVLHKCLATEGYFGYLYNRVQGGSMLPVGGAAVIFWQKEKTQARFDYNHSASTENTTQVVDSFMFNMRHIF